MHQENFGCTDRSARVAPQDLTLTFADAGASCANRCMRSVNVNCLRNFELAKFFKTLVDNLDVQEDLYDIYSSGNFN